MTSLNVINSRTVKTQKDKVQKVSNSIYKHIPKGIFKTPFGTRIVINADSTASGYVYQPIEDYMNSTILPFYSNTHSNAFTGQLMTHYIDKTYQTIRKHFGCKKTDKIILTGNGCTGAVNHLVYLLKLNPTTSHDTAVITSIAEHHSNSLPWRESGAFVKFIDLDCQGIFDLVQLKSTLEQLTKKYKTVYVSLTAGSNVTGVIQPISEICRLVHTFNNAKIFFDFACIAPYVTIDLHPKDGMNSGIDAVFFSVHKFLGGQGTPGVLILDQDLIQSTRPFCCGGGTVKIVSDKEIQYTGNVETREIGGTPNILGSIRIAKVLELKEKLHRKIEYREHVLTKKCQDFLVKCPNITIYNPLTNLNRVPIFVFNISGLHHNLVVKMLSDMFGISTRGGVACSNLYAHKLLGCDCKKYDYVKKCISDHKGVPDYYGFVRVSFNYCMPDIVVNYVLKSIEFIAQYGKSVLASQYRYKKDENSYMFKGFSDFLENRLNSHVRTGKVTKHLLDTYLRQAMKLTYPKNNLHSI